MLLALGLAACTAHSGHLRLPLRAERPGVEIDVYWELAGRPPAPDVPAILIFHGGPGFPQQGWSHTTFWQAVGQHATLLYFHHRGSGRSTPLAGRFAPPDQADAFSLARIAEDAEALRRAVLGPDRRVFVFGQSAGGAIALLYAARHPSRSQGLILVSTTADHRWVSEQRANLAGFLEKLVADSPEAQAGLRAAQQAPACPGWEADTLLFEVLGPLGYTRAGQLRLKAALAAAGRGDEDDLCALHPAPPKTTPAGPSRGLYRTIACRELGWARVAPANCAGGPGETTLFDLRPTLPDLWTPVLVLSSRHDPIVPTPQQREMWELGSWSGYFVPFDDVGHDPTAEAAAKSADEVLNFLARIR